jgi:hypothetical protein
VPVASLGETLRFAIRATLGFLRRLHDTGNLTLLSRPIVGSLSFDTYSCRLGVARVTVGGVGDQRSPEGEAPGSPE